MSTLPSPDASYDGQVTPGGSPQKRVVGCLEITKQAVDDTMSNNCYLLRCLETNEQVLIDAAADAPTLLELIGEHGLTRVITTHQHWDHHRALAEVVAGTGAEVIAGEPDADAITEQTGVPVDRRVQHSDQVSVGKCVLRVIAIAGHTPGSICLLLEPGTAATQARHLFTGDSLFPGGVGNTFGDKDAFVQLLGEVEGKIFGELPDETFFYPGHGNDGYLGDERPKLAEWRERGW